MSVSETEAGEMKYLDRKRVCEFHFIDSDFQRSGTRQLLKKDAVPVPVPAQSLMDEAHINQIEIEDEFYVKKPEKTYSTKGINYKELTIEDIVNLPEPDIPQSPIKPSSSRSPKKNVKKTCMSKCAIKIKRAKRKLEIQQEQKLVLNLFNKIKFPSENARTFVKMLAFHKKRTPWTKKEKDLTIALFYKSPSTYKYMRKMFIKMPGVSTIRAWINETKIYPGFINSYLTQLKSKVNSMEEKEKYCTICFDEMSIMKCLEFAEDQDLIEGFQDLGNQGRTPNEATKALVFMARGLYSHWKIVLCYFLSGTGVKQENLSGLIQSTIQNAMICGLKPQATVCDQGASNRSALSKLGVKRDEPYFHINGQKIFAIYDVPHLFKSMRNNLLNGYYDLNGKKITIDDARATYQLDINNATGSRSLPKITETHMYPGTFDKMKCKLALQLFSKTFAMAIQTAAVTGQLQSTSAMDTALFFLQLNNMFDILNSKCLYSSNPYNCALSDEKMDLKEYLLEGIETFKTLIKVDKSGVQSRPPCFDGVIQSINAIMQMHEVQKSENFTYLLTARLNQDILENFFSRVRQGGGFNSNPSARQFRTILRVNAVNDLIKPVLSANCEPDDDESIEVYSGNSKSKDSVSIILFHDVNTGGTVDEPELEEIDLQNDYYRETNEDEIDTTNTPLEYTLEENSLRYFAGYIVKCTIKKFNCNKCKEKFLKNNEDLMMIENTAFENNEVLLFLRSYCTHNNELALKFPTDFATHLCRISMKFFNKTFNAHKHKADLSSYLFNGLLEVLYNEIKELGELVGECEDHFHYFIRKIIVVRIHKECKWFKTGKRKNSNTNVNVRKLKILKNQ